MASIKIELRKKIRKDGTYPLVLRITKNRKPTYLYLGKNIFESDWDERRSRVRKSHPNATWFNNFLSKKLSKANDILVDLQIKNKDVSIREFKEVFRNTKPQSSFFSVAEEYYTNLELSGNFNRLTAEQPAINHFKRFLKNQDIEFADISISLLEAFKAYLLGKVQVSPRTTFNYLMIIRALYKHAIKNGITDKERYPFGQGKFVIKKPESLKIGLNKEEIRKLEEIELDPASYAHHARNLFLYSFYNAGMRVSDVLLIRWNDIKGGRLYYVMGKNNKPGSLKVPNKAYRILNQYKEQKRNKSDLIFHDLKLISDFSDKIRVQRRIKEVTRRINEKLKEIALQVGIEKKVTMHIARHSFGNISGDSISIQMLQKLYRHSSITTTVNYQKNFLFKEADNALDAVLDF